MTLYFVPIDPTGPPGTFSTLALTGPAAGTGGEFNLNGIAATPDGDSLIVAHSTSEALYTVDPVTGANALRVSVPGPDGILYGQAGCGWHSHSLTRSPGYGQTQTWAARSSKGSSPAILFQTTDDCCDSR